MPAGWGALAGAVIGGVEDNQKTQAAKGIANANNARYDPLVSRATAIADRPYTPYTGETVAPLSANQVTASGNAAREGGQLPLYQQMAGRQWNADTAKQYMNPYISGVLDSSARNLTQQYGSQLADYQRKSGMNDAFGVGRSAALTGALNKNYDQTLSDMYTTGRANAYNNAQGAFANDTNRYGALANNTMQNLENTGAVAQQQQQNVDTSKYKQFLEQRDWSVNNMGPLLSALGKQGDNHVTPAPGDMLGSIMGGAAAGYGMYTGMGNKQMPTSSSGQPGVGINDSTVAGNAGNGSAFQYDNSKINLGMLPAGNP